ncbi:alpha/beta fold hydrolase [Streptomyces sp. NPDC058382]|uniref:alpha/beta fold hydrolase n=1 Tax=unclassified Streptomyces TaxID=2593676 RepID=UPI00364414A8
MAAMLDYLGIDGADVYGTSMGGRLAQQLAARHPHRVLALGIGCTSPVGDIRIPLRANKKAPGGWPGAFSWSG